MADCFAMTTDSTDRGFVLPAALVALTFLYLIAAAGYTLSMLEKRMSDAHAASVRAFYLADGALRDALARPQDTASSRSYAFGEGSAVVQFLPLLYVSSGDRLVRVTATARVAIRRGGPSVRRVETVALVATGESTASATPVAVPGTWREIMDW
jgi:Tfp pilus assembly protein PilX